MPVPPIIHFVSVDLIASDQRMPLTESRPGSPSSAGEEKEAAAPVKPCSAVMRFLINVFGEEQKDISIPLKHDVHFVTAHPCVASPHPEILNGPGTRSLGASLHQDRASSPGLTSGKSCPILQTPQHNSH